MYKIMFKRMVNTECDTEIIECTRPLTRYGTARPPIITHPKTTKFHRSVTYTAPFLWASLPNEVKLINDPDKFNCAVRKLIHAELTTLTRV